MGSESTGADRRIWFADRRDAVTAVSLLRAPENPVGYLSVIQKPNVAQSVRLQRVASQTDSLCYGTGFLDRLGWQ